MKTRPCFLCEAHIKHIFSNRKGKTFSYIKEIKSKGNVVIVRLEGDIDSQSIPVVMSNCCGAQEEKPIDKNVLLDLKDVLHIDSATLASFVLLLNEAKEKGKAIGLINLPSTLKKYLYITKLDHYFKVFKSEKTALSALAV